MKRAKFICWMENAWGLGNHEPYFKLFVDDKVLKVSAKDLIEKYKVPLPFFPGYRTWKQEVRAHRRCHKCWSITRPGTDWERHVDQEKFEATLMETKRTVDEALEELKVLIHSNNSAPTLRLEGKS